MSSVSLINGHMDYTDDEIIKALECCINDNCNDCPETFGNCELTTMRNALDLLKRQKAEIEMLQSESIGKCELAISMRNDNNLDSNCNYCIDKSKAEAFKEFADLAIKKIYENVTPIPQQRYLVKMCIEEIENTKKEMVGEMDV